MVIFFQPRVFCTPAEGVPLGTGYRRMGSKSESGGATRPSKKYDDIFSRPDTICQCDGRTDIGRQQRLSLRIALSGKNAESFRLLLRVRLFDMCVVCSADTAPTASDLGKA